jgi:hypothetical protein
VVPENLSQPKADESTDASDGDLARAEVHDAVVACPVSHRICFVTLKDPSVCNMADQAGISAPR